MKRILVAVDFSELTELVLGTAVELASATGARLRLLHVLAECVSPSAPNLFEPAGDTAARVRAAETDLLLREAELPPGLRDGVRVAVDRPWRSICIAAREEQADLIVIGAHDHGLVERVLGTTAARVVDHAGCPVLVVRPRPATETHETAPRTDEALGARAPRFTQLGTTMLAGAISGAAAGAVGGPPGAIVGATVGGAAGLLAGSALEVASARAESHDRALDDAIGVTRGVIGAREAARCGFAEMERAERAGVERADRPGLAATAALLRAEHARLEGIYGVLLEAYRADDWDDVQVQWTVLETALRRHMKLEEEQLLPVFAMADGAEAVALRREHDELRRLLETLAVNIELRAVTLLDAESLIRALRVHSAREENLLYPWCGEAA
jgi:nucleotide-binding universal stress UspA family protein